MITDNPNVNHVMVIEVSFTSQRGYDHAQANFHEMMEEIKNDIREVFNPQLHPVYVDAKLMVMTPVLVEAYHGEVK